MTKYEVLKIITENPGIKQNDISKHIGIHDSTVSKQANRLRLDKLVYPVYIPLFDKYHWRRIGVNGI